MSACSKSPPMRCLPVEGELVTVSSATSFRLETVSTPPMPRRTATLSLFTGSLLPRIGPLVTFSTSRRASSEGAIAGPSVLISDCILPVGRSDIVPLRSVSGSRRRSLPSAVSREEDGPPSLATTSVSSPGGTRGTMRQVALRFSRSRAMRS